jgi:hypothetical protein
MDSQRSNSTPYIIAAIGNIILLTILPIFLYLILIFIATDAVGPLNIVLIPCSNLIATILFTIIIFFPLSKLLDWLLQKANPNEQYRKASFLFSCAALALTLVLVIGSFTLVVGIILENPFTLQVLGEQDVDSVMLWLLPLLFLGGVPFLLGGFTYWFLLQTSRKLVANRKDKQE